MNVRIRIGSILAASLLVSFTCLSGCATIGMDKATKTTAKMEKVESDMKQAIVQVDATNASLETLTKPDQVGMKKAYDQFAENVNEMEKIGSRIDRHENEMRAQGKEYFTEWEKKGNTYTDPQLRAASDERRSELSKVFNQVPQASSGMRETLNAYLSQLKQIQTYLSTDLTPKGVQSMTPVAQQAIRDGERLKESVKPALSAMQRAMTEMSQGMKGTAAGGK